MNLLIANSHYFEKFIKSSIFYQTGNDVVALSAWPSCYKKWVRLLITRVASLSNKIIVFCWSHHMVGKIFYTS